MKNYKIPNDHIVVIGSGPAGCAAAAAIAKSSFKVIIYERGFPGKDKACGDALLESSIKLLRNNGIGMNRLISLKAIQVDQTDLYDQNSFIGQIKERKYSGCVIPRATLDQELRNEIVRHSGVSIKYGKTVTNIEVLDGGKIKLSLKCRIGGYQSVTCNAAVIATGSTNKLSKKFKIDGLPVEAISSSIYSRVEKQASNTLIFQFNRECKPGYRWLFPVGEKTANMGICILRKKDAINLYSKSQKLLIDYNAIPLGKWRVGLGQLWSGLGSKWHDKAGIVSCGDAAGLINPNSGEGISAALRSGESAGIAISKYIKEGNNLERIEDYSKMIIRPNYPSVIIG